MEIDLQNQAPGLRVAVVSVMGLDQSGLAISVDRYANALRRSGVPSEAVVLGYSRPPELGSARTIPTILELGQWAKDFDIVLWIGLHREDPVYKQQLHLLEELSINGIHNVVMPERTARPDPADIHEFVEVVKAGRVSGLIHLNAREHARWTGLSPTPMTIAATPVPQVLFDVGRARQAAERMDARRHLRVLFIGRLSIRKGFDRLAHRWSHWHAQLNAAGVTADLSVHGQAFTSEVDSLSSETGWLSSRSDVHWNRHFPSPEEMTAWPPHTVGVALSRQEFDGIAISEMLACGVPVLATKTSGHLALAAESVGVQICDDASMGDDLVALALDPDRMRLLGEAGLTDMKTRRSESAVGDRLSSFLISTVSG